MINLQEMFGNRFKVNFDSMRYSADKKVESMGTCIVSTDKCWYYFIPCKYGEISLSDDRGELYFYCNSARIAKVIEESMKMQHGYCLISDVDAMIYFRLKDIEEIFLHAKPRRKRQITQQQRQKLISKLDKYRSQEKRNHPKIA